MLDSAVSTISLILKLSDLHYRIWLDTPAICHIFHLHLHFCCSMTTSRINVPKNKNLFYNNQQTLLLDNKSGIDMNITNDKCIFKLS